MELEITWDGDAPGLKDHRLSLGAFGKTLTTLLSSIRRIGTSLVGNAVGTSESETRGRLANLAKQLDVEIIAIKEGSTGIATALQLNVPPGQSAYLLNDLPERVGLEFLESVEQESRGKMRNASVRKFLRTLPPGVHRQRYFLHENGRAVKTVEFGDYQLAEIEELPVLREVIGDIVGVGFEPGRSEVRVKTEEAGQTLVFGATADQVNSAIDMRGSSVRTLSVSGRPNRLLDIKTGSATRFQVTPEAIEKHIFQRWNGLLRELAK